MYICAQSMKDAHAPSTSPATLYKTYLLDTWTFILQYLLNNFHSLLFFCRHYIHLFYVGSITQAIYYFGKEYTYISIHHLTPLQNAWSFLIRSCLIVACVRRHIPDLDQYFWFT